MSIKLNRGETPKPHKITRKTSKGIREYWEYKWFPYRGAKRETVTSPAYEECILKYCERQAAIERNEYAKKTRETVDDYFTSWLQEVKKTDLAPNTYDTYKSSYLNHIKPAIGTKELQALTLRDGIKLKDRMLNARKTPTTIKNVFAIVNQCLDFAVEEEKIIKNPFRSKKLKLPALDPKEREPYTQEEFSKILTYINSDKVKRLYNPCILAGLHFLIATACRRSEMLGITWDCIDFENHTFTIKQTVVQDGKGKALYKPTTKTKSSKGDIICNDEKLWDKLYHLPTHGDFVFSTSKGTMIIPRNFDRAVKSLVIGAGVKWKGVHAIRHGVITMLCANGETDRRVMIVSRHKDTRMISRYNHTIDKTKKEVWQSMGNLMQQIERPSV